MDHDNDSMLSTLPWAKRIRQRFVEISKSSIGRSSQCDEDGLPQINEPNIQTSKKLNSFVEYVTGTTTTLEGYFFDKDSEHKMGQDEKEDNNFETLPVSPTSRESSTPLSAHDPQYTLHAQNLTSIDTKYLQQPPQTLLALSSAQIHSENSHDVTENFPTKSDEKCFSSPTAFHKIVKRLSPPHLIRKRPSQRASEHIDDASVDSSSSSSSTSSSSSSSSSASSMSARKNSLSRRLSPRQITYSKRLKQNIKRDKKSQPEFNTFIPLETIDEVEVEEDLSILSFDLHGGTVLEINTSHRSSPTSSSYSDEYEWGKAPNFHSNNDLLVNIYKLRVLVPRPLRYLILIALSMSFVTGIWLGVELRFNHRGHKFNESNDQFISEIKIDSGNESQPSTIPDHFFVNETISPINPQDFFPPELLSNMSATKAPIGFPSTHPSSLQYSAHLDLSSSLPSLSKSMNLVYNQTDLPHSEQQRKYSMSPSYSIDNLKLNPSYRPSNFHSIVALHDSTDISTSTPFETPSILSSEAPETPSAKKESTRFRSPSLQPRETPSLNKSFEPSFKIKKLSTNMPSVSPTNNPSSEGSLTPSIFMSEFPTATLPILSSNIPSIEASLQPTLLESELPTNFPTTPSTKIPSLYPSIQPSSPISEAPTIFQTDIPSLLPSMLPSPNPSSNPSLLPTFQPTQPVIFYVLPEITYVPNAEFRIYNQVNGVPSDARFIVHMSEFNSVTTGCDERVYSIVKTSITTAADAPVFLLPSDNDSLDCPNPDEAWFYWNKYWGRFEENWGHSFTVQRQFSRPENFAFFVDNFILFIGVHIITRVDSFDQALLMKDNLEWTTSNIEQYRNQGLESVVIFGHSSPQSVHDEYFGALRKVIADTNVSVAYVHGDTFIWKVQNGTFGSDDFLQVSIKSGVMNPLRVTAKKGDVSPFHFELL